MSQNYLTYWANYIEESLGRLVFALNYLNTTLGFIKNGTLVFIHFKNLCARHQEEVLRIPKHPQHAKFG